MEMIIVGIICSLTVLMLMRTKEFRTHLCVFFRKPRQRLEANGERNIMLLNEAVSKAVDRSICEMPVENLFRDYPYMIDMVSRRKPKILESKNIYARVMVDGGCPIGFEICGKGRHNRIAAPDTAFVIDDSENGYKYFIY